MKTGAASKPRLPMKSRPAGPPRRGANRQTEEARVSLTPERAGHGEQRWRTSYRVSRITGRGKL